MALTPSVLGAASSQSLQVLHAQDSIQVDGILDEPAWQQAAVIADFTQQDPAVGEPATERTEVRVILSGSTLHIGVICFDSQPDGIIGRERRRDNNLANDDRFEIILDTFHDHRNGFYFVTNPLGTRFDALITDEGVAINHEWDEAWWVEARITEQGWTLEFEIPLAILRAPETWTLGESISCVSCGGRMKSPCGAAGAGTLRLFKSPRPVTWQGWRASRPDCWPASLRICCSERARRERTVMSRMAQRAALKSRRLVLPQASSPSSRSIPTSGQADVDEAVVNLTRFPLFFPEKREFFLVPWI